MTARRKPFLAVLLASVMSIGGLGLAAETRPKGEMRFAPIFDYFWPSGIGPRVEEASLMRIDPLP
jgi:hypothetical protein